MRKIALALLLIPSFAFSWGMLTGSNGYYVDTAGVGLTKNTNVLSSSAVEHISYQSGAVSTIVNAKTAFHKYSMASTVDNLEGSASVLTVCGTNPTITMYECGTSTTCAAPTTIGTVTITATGTVVDGTISAAAITAGDYVAFATSAGSCTLSDIAGTAQVHSN